MYNTILFAIKITNSKFLIDECRIRFLQKQKQKEAAPSFREASNSNFYTWLNISNVHGN